jgi:hypothetical protein
MAGLLERLQNQADDAVFGANDYWNEKIKRDRQSGSKVGAEDGFMARSMLSPITFYNAADDSLHASPLGMGQDFAAMGGMLNKIAHDKLKEQPFDPWTMGTKQLLTGATGLLDKIMGPSNDAADRKSELMDQRNADVNPETFMEKMGSGMAENLPLSFMGVGPVAPETLASLLARVGIKDLGKAATGATLVAGDTGITAGVEGLGVVADKRKAAADAEEQKARASYETAQKARAGDEETKAQLRVIIAKAKAGDPEAIEQVKFLRKYGR